MLLWNGIITFLLIRWHRQHQVLVRGTEKKRVEEILGEILREIQKQEKKEKELEEEIKKLFLQGEFHFQKLGLVKFNPFAEMGGSQSFSLALLDQRGSGMVITGLHGRDLTRLYVKKVKEGKPEEGELSREEEMAIKQCLKQRKRKENNEDRNN